MVVIFHKKINEYAKLNIKHRFESRKPVSKLVKLNSSINGSRLFFMAIFHGYSSRLFFTAIFQGQKNTALFDVKMVQLGTRFFERLRRNALPRIAFVISDLSIPSHKGIMYWLSESYNLPFLSGSSTKSLKWPSNNRKHVDLSPSLHLSENSTARCSTVPPMSVRNVSSE